MVGEYQRLQEENAALRRDVAESEARVRALDGEVLELNQLRQDVAKRIDDLVGRIETLDARLGAQGA